MDEELRHRLRAQKVRGVRLALVTSLRGQGDPDECLDTLVSLEADLAAKLQHVDLTALLQDNCQTLMDINVLLHGLQALRDVGCRLCASGGDTVPKGDRVITMATSSLRAVLDRIQGGAGILRQLGYTEVTDTEVRIPAADSIAMDTVAGVTADLMVAADEIERYSGGSHPHPQNVASVFPKKLRESMVRADESCVYENAHPLKEAPAPRQSTTGPGHNQTHQDAKPKPIPKPRPKVKPGVAKKPDLTQLTQSTEGSTGTELNTSTGGATRLSTSQGAPSASTDCDLCGNYKATTICPSCEGQRSFCDGCDRSWHAHIKRRHHERRRIGSAFEHRPTNILRPKASRNTREGATQRGSIVVVPGKRSTSAYQLEQKVTDPSQINGVYCLSTPTDQRPHPQLAKKSNIVASVKAQGVDATVPSKPNILQSQNDKSPDTHVDDTYENVDFHERSQSGSGRTVASSRAGSIPTVVQEFSIELLSDLETEGDLHRRKVKVENKLTKVEHRLGSIASGMEQISIADRISLMKEQDFLKGYKSDLDNKIVIETGSQQDRVTARHPIPKMPFQELVGRLQSSLNDIRLDEAAQSASSGDDYTYATEIKPPIVQAGATFPRWQRKSVDESHSKPGTKESTTVQNEIYGSQEPDSRRSSTYMYEDIEEPAMSSEPHTLPKRSSGPSKELIRKTMSQPIGPNDTWPSKWECSHCTMYNAKGTRVCSMCSKTSDSPILLVQSDDGQSSSQNRPLPSLPPDAVPPGLVGKSPDTRLLLKRLVILQKRYSYHLDPGMSDDDLLNELGEKFHDSSLGIMFPATHQEAAPLSPEDKIKKTRIRDQEYQARQLLYQLKEADQHGFTYEEFQLALTLNNNHSPSQPVDWLRSEWMSRVNKVVTVATKVLTTIHPKAKLSQKEARLTLVNSNGTVDAAAIGGVDAWKDAYEELLTNLAQDGLPTGSQRAEVVAALTESEGDLSVASMCLFRNNQSHRLIENIWNCESSVYGNDEVAMTFPGRVSQDKRYDRVSDKSLDLERRILILMAEFGLETKDKARNVIRIWDRPQQLADTVTIADVIEAIRNCGNTTRAMSYLSQTCAVCEEKFPAGKIHMLSFCQCKLCNGCLKKYFSMTIKEKHVRDLVCPMCQKPSIENREQFEQHIQLLTLMLKHHLSLEDVDVFEKKLRDWNLMQDPNFRWCSYDDCSCGFVFARHHQGELKMQCPDCQRPTCFRCQKPWESQHYNLTCEQFEDWKLNNDPSTQLEGLAKLLQNNGIDCPNPRCRCRYAISKGGCMHFTCSQCGHEFCSGCYKAFHRGSGCPSKLVQCGKSGLHCHHPRNCLYYLRNESIEKLQQLLQRHNVSYDMSVPGGERQSQSRCLVQELKDSNKDEACGRPILPNHAGLCEAHYKEYLVSLINTHSIDPISLMNMDEVKIQFARCGQSVPSLEPGEMLAAYKQRLIMLVQQQMPLPRYQKRPTVVHSNHTASMVT